MITFNKEYNSLVFKDNLTPFIDEYVESDQYISYMNYLNNGIVEDIKKYLVKDIDEILKSKYLFIDVDRTIVELRRRSSIKNSDYYEVCIKLYFPDTIVEREENGIKNLVHDKFITKSIKILELPYMDESGVLYKDGKLYTVLNSLKLGHTVSFDGSVMKVVDSGGTFEFSNSRSPKVSMFKKEIYAIDLMAMAFKDMYGSSIEDEDFVVELSSMYTKSLMRYDRTKLLNTKDFTINKNLSHDEILSLNLDNRFRVMNDRLRDEFYYDSRKEHLTSLSIRNNINEVCSLYNAVGKVLSRDVINQNGNIIVKAGKVLTNNDIKEIHRNFIDTIFVSAEYNLTGVYMAEPIFLGNIIYRGTPVIEDFLDEFPQLAGYDVVPEDLYYDSSQGYVIYPGTEITDKLQKFFRYIGLSKISYTSKLKSKRILVQYFEEEYINNRHFPVCDLDGVISDDIIENSIQEYVFIDVFGNISESLTTISGHDIIALTSMFMKFSAGNHLSLVAHIDRGSRKLVDQSGHSFHKAFIKVFDKFLTGTIGTAFSRKVNTAKDLNNTDALNEVFKYTGKNLFSILRTDMKVIDVLGLTNPVDCISGLTRVNTIVANSNSISDKIRMLTMGHYGRICPYETPQSKKLGVVNNMATGCKIVNGIMKTPYYKVTHDGCNKIDFSSKIYMSVEEEEKFRIADISSLDYDSDGVIKTVGKVPARVPNLNALEKMIFANIDVSIIQYVSVFSDQHCSIATTTIPFCGANDAARTTFATSMVKQSKSLIHQEVPIVCTTGFMNIPAMTKIYRIFAEDDGRVVSVSSNRIVVRYDNPEFGEKVYTFSLLRMTTYSVITLTVLVAVGDIVHKGDTLVTSNFVKGRVMTTGVNALIAYISNGFNYEDGIPVSERLCSKLTSYGVNKDTFKISKKVSNFKIFEIDYENYLSEGSPVLKKLEVRSGDNSAKDKVSTFYSHNTKGFVTDWSYERDKRTDRKTGVIIRSVSFDKLHSGDKICNRHGNKGVECKTYKNSEMYYLSNGEFIDVYFNPCGVVSRMNLGQILESKIGLAAYVLGVGVLCDSFNSPSTEDVRMLLKYTYELANSKNGEEDSIFLRYPMLPKDFHEYVRGNMSNIRNWRNTFDELGKVRLIDPKTGKELPNKVDIGINYIYKLIQEVDNKLHSRGGPASSNYVQKTESPTKGASKGGGQRQGYMELDALAAYGCVDLIDEIMNERGDSYIRRNNNFVDVLCNDDKYKIDDKYAIRRSVEWLCSTLNALGVEVSTDKEDGIIIDTDIHNREYFKRSVIYADSDENSKSEFLDDKEELLNYRPRRN